MAVFEYLHGDYEVVSAFRNLIGIGAFGTMWFVGTNIETLIDQRQSRWTRIPTRSVIQNANVILASLKKRGDQFSLLVRGGFPDGDVLPARNGRVGFSVIIIVYQSLEVLIGPLIRMVCENEAAIGALPIRDQNIGFRKNSGPEAIGATFIEIHRADVV